MFGSLSGLMFHKSIQGSCFFRGSLDKFNCAGADNAGESIAVATGLFSIDQTIIQLHFEAGLVVFLYDIKLMTFPGTVEIQRELIIFICKAEVERNDVGPIIS